MYEFRWNQANVEHIAEHGVSAEEAEWVVQHARRPFPEYRGESKWRVWGQTEHGRYLQVVYVFDPADVIYVIHARPLEDTDAMCAFWSGYLGRSNSNCSGG
jgi:uncharacterized DUF497 family protein